MNDTLLKYDIKKLPSRIKAIRNNRSEQYKDALKHYNDLSKICKKSSKPSNDLTQACKDAKSLLDKYERYKPCLSQEALGDAIEVSRQTIIDWEKGNTYPSIKNLIQLCSIFDCNMDYLLGFVETPITEPVSIAHYFSNIDSSIIEYGLKHEEYLDCLNFFMHPDNCSLLFNDITISAWRKFMTDSAIADIKTPLKEAVINAYDEYTAITPIQEISKKSYKAFLEEKFPMKKLILRKESSENGYYLKSCFHPLIYQNFFNNKEFNYVSFINYLVESTFEQLSNNALIEVHKIKLAKAFVKLFEQYLLE